MMTQGERHEKAPPEETVEHGNPLSDIQDLVGELMDGVRAFAPGSGARFPRYDLVETANEYFLTFDLPGLSRDEVEIITQGDQVIVSGDRERPELSEGDQVRRTERQFGRFRRSVRVPADVELDAVRARLTDGVLTVTLPRRSDHPGRKVDIDT